MIRKLKFIVLLVWWTIGQAITDAAGVSWAVYAFGGLVCVLSIAGILRLIYLDGFRDGVDSVPLDGADLASGDEQAFAGDHRWNADLGAWEKPR